MKENLENETLDAEKLLREKSWEQLSEAERKGASEMFADRAEYERMRAMVHQLRSSNGFSEDELVPAETTRKNLLDAFDDEQRRRRVLWWNSIGFWFRDRLRLDIPAVRFAVAGVILFLGVFTILRLFNSNGVKQNDFVQGNNAIPSKDSLLSPKVIPQNTPVVSNLDTVNDERNAPEVVIPKRENVEPKAVVNQPAPIVPPSNNGDANNIVDTAASRMAFAGGNDTSVVPIAVNVLATGGSDPAVCCGATIQLTAPVSNNATFSWTPSFSLADGNATNATYVVIGQAAPTSRALVEDENLVDVFFSLR